MPQTITIAAFVLGSVLLLIALLGGSFKIFNAEVASPVGNLLRLSAFLLSIVFFLVSFLSAFVELPKPPRPETVNASGGGGTTESPSLPNSPQPRTSERPLPQPSRIINLSGYWRDSRGTVYFVTQNGNEIEYVGSNANTGMQSNGTGTISGNDLEVRFRTSYNATGDGKVTISDDGKKLTGNYNDSVYGSYSGVSWKVE